MQPFPHHYEVTADTSADGMVALNSPGVSTLASAPPAEFGGPGDQWSPETLFAAAAADCYLLSFKAVAGASKLDWTHITCRTTAVLDRIDKVTRFTEMTHHVTLVVPADTSIDRARSILEKSEHVCLVSNSLNTQVHLEASIEQEGAA